MDVLNVFKKIFGVFLVIVVAFVFSACGSKIDKSWILKSKSKVINEGLFKYYLRESFNKAVDVFSESGVTLENLASQKIGDKSFDVWVRDDAVNSCKELLALQELFRKENLSFTEDEKAKIETDVNKIWQSLSSTLEKYSISKDDVKIAYSEFKLMYEKLFEHFYGANGKNKILDDELLVYYKNNYINYSMLTKYACIAANQDEVSTVQKATNEQIEEARKSAEEYVNLINSGSKTVREVADLLKEKDDLQSDSLETETVSLKNAEMSDEILDKLKSLEVKKAGYVQIEDAFVILVRNDISGCLPDFSDENVKKDIIKDMKTDEFLETVKSLENSMNIEVNTRFVNEFVPVKMFGNA